LNRSPCKTTIGGQALIEGLMMRGPESIAAVVRRPDGQLEIKKEPVKKPNSALRRAPFLRGALNFIEMMKTGISYISYSAEVSATEELEPDKLDLWIDKRFGKEKGGSIILGLATFLGLAFSVILFFILPTFLAGFLGRFIDSSIVRNLTEGLIRIIIFISYLAIVSNMKDMQRLFAYHGAEHKTIFAYEAGEELTVESVRPMPRQHPRCGTSFLFIVMIISILVFSLITWSSTWVRVVLRLALLPVVVSISYELNRLIGRYDNLFTKILRAPGMWMQNLTTKQPDDSMIEIAITALKLVIPEEKNSDRW
jgi:uncharacterized protein YqhQ